MIRRGAGRTRRRPVTRGRTATFRVSATNVANSFPAYQWRFNGAEIAGATTNYYSVTNAQLSHQGNYSVVVIATNIPTPSPRKLELIVDACPRRTMLTPCGAVFWACATIGLMSLSTPPRSLPPTPP